LIVPAVAAAVAVASRVASNPRGLQASDVYRGSSTSIEDPKVAFTSVGQASVFLSRNNSRDFADQMTNIHPASSYTRSLLHARVGQKLLF
jgi:hypothetical protein